MTRSAFRQRVQTYTRRGRPSSSILTFWRFGLKRRLVATIEWLREFPNAGPLPQLKQTLAIGCVMVASYEPTEARSSAAASTASAAWRPWSRLSPPARASACSRVSQVITPKAQGTPVESWTSWIPRAASEQT